MAEINEVVNKPEVDEEASSIQKQASGKWDWVAETLQGLPALIWHLVCAVGASFITVGWLDQLLPIWIAVPLGTVLGVVFGALFAFLAAQLISSGATTVLELSISSSICLVLAGILFPVFGQAREKARQTTCMSNLKSISLSMLMYSQDNDGVLPVTGNWMDTLSPYDKTSAKSVKLESHYHCPSVNGKSTYAYAYNSNVASQPTVKIADPRAKMLVYDSATQARSASDPGTSLPKKGRHSGGNTIAFADGHARWIKDGDDRATSSEDSPVIIP